jgi:hypothetical protein
MDSGDAEMLIAAAMNQGGVRALLADGRERGRDRADSTAGGGRSAARPAEAVAVDLSHAASHALTGSLAENRSAPPVDPVGDGAAAAPLGGNHGY